MEPFPDFPEPQLPPKRTTNFAPLLIAGAAFSLVVVILSLNLKEEPVFEKIDEISVHYLSNKGLTQKALTHTQKTQIIRCLFENTRRLEKADLETEILPSTYLIEIRNGDGRNSLELISRNNLADTRGYYFNDCIYGFIH